ncbi:hypothetical protein FK531_00550 [Rhodococcus spelaei]|uniref:Uncharacterized protein n=1 Tax=Rhodococcus spelaei TaxID=2546320 RepID=A0A541BQL7_9NOCA|nr:hypothetical protein [Rhodococcus spelaei]TQF74632.1 hypothetical protein FK531_00550 [Rhodococcus spelaei]
MGSGKDKDKKASSSTPATKPLAVGDQVVTSADPVLPDGDPSEQPGVIVDDFAGSLADDADYGRDWAHARRWAIKLDDGRLVFRSSEEVERPAG